jgi:hypothetical protein
LFLTFERLHFFGVSVVCLTSFSETLAGKSLLELPWREMEGQGFLRGYFGDGRGGD